MLAASAVTDDQDQPLASPDPDAPLLTRFVETGDREALSVLFARHADAAYRVAARIVGASDAEDVVQQAMMKAMRGSARFRGGSRVRTWLLGIVINTARTMRRDAATRRRHELAAVPEEDAAVDAQARADDRGLLLEAVSRLPEHERLPLWLRYAEQLSPREIATTLGIPEGTVRSQVSRALDRLRELVPRLAGAPAVALVLGDAGSLQAPPELLPKLARTAATGPAAAAATSFAVAIGVSALIAVGAAATFTLAPWRKPPAPAPAAIDPPKLATAEPAWLDAPVTLRLVHATLPEALARLRRALPDGTPFAYAYEQGIGDERSWRGVTLDGSAKPMTAREAIAEIARQVGWQWRFERGRAVLWSTQAPDAATLDVAMRYADRGGDLMRLSLLHAQIVNNGWGDDASWLALKAAFLAMPAPEAVKAIRTMAAANSLAEPFRGCAVCLLAERRDADGLLPLAGTLDRLPPRNENPMPGEIVIDALGRLGDARAAPALIAALGSPFGGNAADAIAAIDDDASVPPLAALVGGQPSTDKRAMDAARALGGMTAPAAAKALLDAMAPANNTVDWSTAAASGMSWSRSSVAETWMMAAAQDGGDRRRQALGFAGLARSHGDRAIDVLIGIIQHARAAADLDGLAYSLGSLGGPGEDHCSDPGAQGVSHEVRVPRLWQAVVAKLPEARDAKLRGALIALLRPELDAPSADACIRALRDDPSAYVRDWAAHQLIELAESYLDPSLAGRKAQAVQALTAAASDRHPRVREMALDGLHGALFSRVDAALERPVVDVALTDAGDADVGVRLAAINAVHRYLRLDGDLPELVRTRLTKLRDDPATAPEVRDSIAHAFGETFLYSVTIPLPEAADFAEPEAQRPDG